MIYIIQIYYIIYTNYFSKRMPISSNFIQKEAEIINEAWDNIKSNKIDKLENSELKETIASVLDLLDKGIIRIVTYENGLIQVHEWIKKAILLYFRLFEAELIEGGPSKYDADTFSTEAPSFWYDKIHSKFLNWDKRDFQKAGLRAVPGSYVRHGAYIAKNVILMPSFINIGAYIDEGTMVDTWATVGSCAQIGKNCHISGGAGIGGVLEPIQSAPVIIEDNCFIGARSEIAEGVTVEKGSVISMGVYIGASTKIIDRETGEIHYGKVPAYSVVVPGNIQCKDKNISLYAAVIVKKVDEQTRSKTSINELLRNNDN